MSADQFWIAEAIKEARQNIAMDGGSHFHRITVHLSDELEQARIELEDERERVNVQREDIRTLRMEVQRLTERNVSMEAEIRILTEEARRSDAGRVEVPEIGALLLERIEVRSKGYVEMAAMLNDWIKANARLSPSPQPATGEMVAELRDAAKVILDEWDVGHLVAAGSWMFQDAFDALRDALQASPQPSADVVVDKGGKNGQA